MALFEKEEVWERLLSLMREIRDATYAIKYIIDNHGSSWSNLRGKMFNLLTSLRKMEDLSGYLPESELDSELKGTRRGNLKELNAHWASKVEELAKENIDPKYFEFPFEIELSIMETCSSIIEALDFYIPIVESHLNRDFGSQLTVIHDFVSTHRDHFSGNWAIAVVHLAAMEVLINRRREDYGLTKVDKDVGKTSLEEKYAELMKQMTEKNTGPDTGLIGKAEALWNVRDSIMHRGMEPDSETLSMIIRWSRTVIDSLTGNSGQD